jgi:hypothetical protein
MKNDVRNPFMMYPYRKQPTKRVHPNRKNAMGGNGLVEGMVTLGSLAIIGSSLPGIINSIQK